MADPLLAELDRHRRTVPTPSGDISVLDVGEGRPAVLVHGVVTNAFLWRNVIAALRGRRRLVAIDLPLHGRTAARPGQDFSLAGLAAVIEQVCDALALGPIDLVANDTGGAIAQMVAARGRVPLATLVLTNCDTHDNLPPPTFAPTVRLARLGLLKLLTRGLVDRPERARRIVFRPAYEHPERLGDDVIRSFLAPVLGGFRDARELERMLVSLRASDLVAIEPALRRLEVPTLIVWGTRDPFFERRWAHWLARTIPGARGVIEIPGARLFFPDERADELVPRMEQHWAEHAPATTIAGAAAR